jgi:hypothetical protein
VLLFTRDWWLDYVELVTYGTEDAPSSFPLLSLFKPARQLA